MILLLRKKHTQRTEEQTSSLHHDNHNSELSLSPSLPFNLGNLGLKPFKTLLKPRLLTFTGFAIVLLCGTGCSFFATRPAQELSDMTAAIRAAREVEADSRTPDLFRLANEYSFKAKREYRYKNFQLARQYAAKARYYAEMAEFESISRGAIRTEITDIQDPEGFVAPRSNLSDDTRSPSSTEAPTPSAGAPAESYDLSNVGGEDLNKLSPPPATPGGSSPISAGKTLGNPDNSGNSGPADSNGLVNGMPTRIPFGPAVGPGFNPSSNLTTPDGQNGSNVTQPNSSVNYSDQNGSNVPPAPTTPNFTQSY